MAGPPCRLSVLGSHFLGLGGVSCGASLLELTPLGLVESAADTVSYGTLALYCARRCCLRISSAIWARQSGAGRAWGGGALGLDESREENGIYDKGVRAP